MTVYASHLRRLAAGALLLAGPAFAQAPSPAPLDAVPEKVAPNAKPSEPAQNLSEKLNQSNGVIHPKKMDPAIEKPAPRTGDPNIIPAPEGSPAPQPK